MVGQRRQGIFGKGSRSLIGGTAVLLALTFLGGPGNGPAWSQTYAFSDVRIEGSERIEAATILKIAGISEGQPLSAAELNDAHQRLLDSGLFATASLVPSGGTLIIQVVENPTINVVSFEGNDALEDEELAAIVTSQSRHVFSPVQAEADAALITQAYSDSGRLAARVEPRVIVRDGNRVDLVFEIREGKVAEINRLSFTGNRNFSDRRLRQVLATKQAGILRALMKSDTFVADRTEFDKQLLTDFYRSRGYIDMQVLGVSSEFSRERDAFFQTFNIREGVKYRIGKVSIVSAYEGVAAEPYQDQIRVRSGSTYTPTAIDRSIRRMESLALKQGVDFLAIEPRLTRDPATQTLDVQFVLSKGARNFVERIDIEGNATTLDEVIRRQFRSVEGDPFNPQEIRDSADRIRALGFFSDVTVEPRQGTGPDQAIIDVNVTEQPTGSLTFGANYSVSDGIGFNVALSESNFLGRGQYLSLSLDTTSDNQSVGFVFSEPAFLDRDLRFRFGASYATSNYDNAEYSTKRGAITPSIDFPLGEFTRLSVLYDLSQGEIYDVDVGSSPILKSEEAQGSLFASSVGYGLSFDNRIGGIDPIGGVVLRFGQEYAGVGGDIQSVTTTAFAAYETRVFAEEVRVRAEVEGGAVNFLNADSRIVDRYTGNGKIRGFESNGLGPRDLYALNEDALGGNFFAVARLEAQFPIGLPVEYGLSGGLFADIGSVWGLDNVNGTPGPLQPGGIVDDDLHLRSAVGVTLFWESAIGPLRFNFSKALMKEDYDEEQTFDLTVSTSF